MRFLLIALLCLVPAGVEAQVCIPAVFQPLQVNPYDPGEPIAVMDTAGIVSPLIPAGDDGASSVYYPDSIADIVYGYLNWQAGRPFLLTVVRKFHNNKRRQQYVALLTAHHEPYPDHVSYLYSLEEVNLQAKTATLLTRCILDEDGLTMAQIGPDILPPAIPNDLYVLGLMTNAMNALKADKKFQFEIATRDWTGEKTQEYIRRQTTEYAKAHPAQPTAPVTGDDVWDHLSQRDRDYLMQLQSKTPQ